MGVDKKWFVDRLKDVGLSQRQAAFKIGIDPAAMSLVLSGGRKMKLEEVRDFSRILKVDADEVMIRAGVLPRKKVVKPALRVVGASGTASGPSGDGGSPEGARNSPQEAFGAKVVGWIDGEGLVHQEGLLGPALVSRPSDVAMGCVALRFQSGAMDGWLAYYDPAGMEPGEGVGLLCVVRKGDGERVLRSIKRGYGKNDFILVKMDGVTTENAEIIEVHPVLWMRQRG